MRVERESRGGPAGSERRVDILPIVELWKIHSCKDGLPLDLNAPELFIPSILKPRIQKRYRLFRIMGSFFLA
jgi:hypothetical protein